MEFDTSSIQETGVYDNLNAAASSWTHTRLLSSIIEYVASVIWTKPIDDKRFTARLYNFIQTKMRFGKSPYNQAISLVTVFVTHKPRTCIMPVMKRRIIHACGHEQAHHLTGFDSQQERKTRWLKTTSGETASLQKSELRKPRRLSSAAISHLDLLLTGTDRQISWASTIRSERLPVLTNSNSSADCYACLQVTDAKWWIDCRDLTDVDLMAAATLASNIQSATAITASIADIHRTA